MLGRKLAILALFSCVLSLVHGSPDPDAVVPEAETNLAQLKIPYHAKPPNNEKWMSHLPDDDTIGSVSMPGTHDSLSHKMHHLGCSLGQHFTRCQTWTLKEQLQAGVRFIDLRLRRTANALAVHHGICYLGTTFAAVMTDIAAFLQANPSEFLLMRMRNDEAPPGEGAPSFTDLLHKKYFKEHPEWDKLFARGCNSKCTVKQLRGKIEALRDGWSEDDFGVSWSAQWKQDEYETITAKAKWKAIEHGFENTLKVSPHLFHINFASAQLKVHGIPLGGIGKIARYVVPRIAYDIPRQFVGAVPMDFPTSDAIASVIQQNFKTRVAQKWTGKCNGKTFLDTSACKPIAQESRCFAKTNFLGVPTCNWRTTGTTTGA